MGDRGGGVVAAVAVAAAVARNGPRLHMCQGVFDPCPDPLMDGVEFLLPPRRRRFARAGFAVGHDHPRIALRAAVGHDVRTVALVIDAGFGVGARQSSRLPGNGVPTATVNRVWASMTTCNGAR